MMQEKLHLQLWLKKDCGKENEVKNNSYFYNSNVYKWWINVND